MKSQQKTAVSLSPYLYIWILLMACGNLQTAFAESMHSQRELQQVAAKYIKQHFTQGEEVILRFGRLDKRLQLSRCRSQLSAFIPGPRLRLGASSIGIMCNDRHAWKVFIPVTIRVYAQVVVSKHNLPRATIISAADLGTARKELSRLYDGYFSSPRELLGMKLKRPARAGGVFNPRMVSPRQLVKRGEPVTILAEHNGLVIRVMGEALMDGKLGQLVRVQNSRSGREIHAEVISLSTVRIKM